MARAPFLSMEVSRSSVSVLTRALQHADAQLKADGTTELQTLGQLVEHDIEALVRGRIPGAGRSAATGVPWSEMRTVAKPYVVYVAPHARGTKDRRRQRKNFGPIMLNRAMRPALERRRPETFRRFNALLGKVCGRFNSG